MKVLVIGRALPQRKSSYGKFEFEQAALLSKLNDVIYLFLDHRSIKYSRSIKHFKGDLEGVRYLGRSVPIGGLPLPLIWKAKDRSYKLMLEELDRCGWKPDLVYAHFPLITLSPNFVRDLSERKTALVCMEHWSSILNHTLDSKREELLSICLKRSAVYGCVSRALAQAVGEYATRLDIEYDPVVVPNYVRNSFFNKNNHSDCEITQKDKVRFVSVGRFVESKRFDLLVRAFAAVNSDDAELVLAGDGPLMGDLKKLALNLDVGDRIVFPGWLNSDSVSTLFSKSDYYVSSSSIETFGMPFAEAWASGLFCIGADSNSLSGSFTDGRGALFVANDLDSLISVMRKAMSGDLCHMDSKMISEWAYAQFSEAAIVQKLQTIFDSVVTE